MKSIISVNDLGKRYRIGRREAAYATVRESLAQAVKSPFSRLKRSLGSAKNGSADFDDHIWALKDVSFEVEPGEVVGIIGRNGAGKSTLLKVLSRITEPTEGSVSLWGRVASLLEVGTGFHAELTGRENIYLNGSILGMRKAEIDRRFDEIVDFAEVERFLDTPVKRYSSGMHMRLAFAVAAHLEPEVLVIDEVLAVGDHAFQKKCLSKMSEVARQGRTVLFVSHNLVAVRSLCTRVIWLLEGRPVGNGSTFEVVRDYLKTAAAMFASARVWEDPETRPGNDRIRLSAVRLVPPPGVTAETLGVRTPFRLQFDYANLTPDVKLNLSLILCNEENTCVFASTTIDEPKWDGRRFPRGDFQSECLVPGNLLNDGIHRVSILFVEDTTNVIFRLDDVLEFEVHDDLTGRGGWYGKWIGVVRPELQWKTEMLDNA